jgi:hypothetical protein
MRPDFFRAASLLAGLCFSHGARAQTCCTTTGANELGVVDRDHFAALGAELVHDRGYGTFDADGSFSGLRGAEIDDFVFSLGGGIRLFPRALQLNAALPLRFQYRELGAAQGSHFGLGDASASLRYLLVDGGRPGAPDGRFVPFVEPFAGARLPTGTGPDDASDPTLVDATGDGAAMFYAGVLLVEFLNDDDALKLEAVFGHRFDHELETADGPRSFGPGPEFTARAGFGHRINLHWSWDVFLALRATGASSLNGATVADSSTHRLRAGAALAHYLRFPTWQLVVSASFDPPIDGFGSNVPFAGSSLILGLRRNFLH